MSLALPTKGWSRCDGCIWHIVDLTWLPKDYIPVFEWEHGCKASKVAGDHVKLCTKYKGKKTMGFITNLIPAPYIWIAKSALFAMVLLAGMYAGHKVTSAYYSPLLTKQQEATVTQKVRADTNVAAYLTLAKVAQTQNAAIEALKSSGEKRAADAVKAVQAARANSNVHLLNSKQYLNSQAPLNSDKCTAARGLIDEYHKTRTIASTNSVRQPTQ